MPTPPVRTGSLEWSILVDQLMRLLCFNDEDLEKQLLSWGWFLL